MSVFLGGIIILFTIGKSTGNVSPTQPLWKSQGTLYSWNFRFEYIAPVRNTIYGRIRGKTTSRLHGKEVEEYLGIPYAAPPVGKRRFERPEPPTTWRPQILDTNILPPACPTIDLSYLQFHRPGFNRSSQDCLYLNIYVPKVRQSRLAVLLFIHGGSNNDGMGAFFDGDILAAYGNIIVINFNYRLNFLGFYADKSEGIKGNNGLFDQVLAMKWVQQNIHFFNGDPNRVTVHGHSAGAGDIGFHLISELGKGLFRQAIIHSGSPFAFWVLSDCVRKARTLVKPVDCQPKTSAVAADVDIDIRKFYEKSSNYSKFLSATNITFDYNLVRVIIDGIHQTESPDKRYYCGEFHQLDSVLFLTNKDEGLIPSPPELVDFYTRFDVNDFIDQYINLFYEKKDTFADDIRMANKIWKQNNITKFPEYLHLVADVWFFAPMVKMADLVSQKIRNSYFLSFDYRTQNITPEWINVQHGWDNFYVYGVPLIGTPVFPYTPRDAEVSLETMAIISNFVKTGYASYRGQIMSRYNPTSRPYNKLDYVNGRTVVTQETNFRQERMDFWDRYLYDYDDFDCSTCRRKPYL